MARHRQDYKIFLNGNKLFVSSYDLFNEFGVENCKIERVEYYKCDTLQELRKREGEHIKNTECVNKYTAGRTQQEYYDDNIDKIKEYRKEYYQNNIDKIKDYYKNKNKIKDYFKKQ